MTLPNINKKIFKFKYLPEYAQYLLDKKLEEYVRDGIRFAREMELPMLKPLSKVPEADLVKMSMDSNRHTLEALAKNNIAEYIEANLEKWVSNKLGIIDKDEIEVEDLTLAYHMKRKLFSYYLYGYTQNAPIQQLIINEVDVYTSMEELYSLKVYMQMLGERKVK